VNPLLHPQIHRSHTAAQTCIAASLRRRIAAVAHDPRGRCRSSAPVAPPHGDP